MKKIFPLLLIASTISGCGTGRVIDTSLISTPQKKIYKSLRIEECECTVPVPKEISKEFEKYLSEALYEVEKFQKGNDLTLKYRFTSLNQGNQFARFMGGVGFMGSMVNSGEGVLIVEVTYVDSKGNEVGKIHSEGKIGGGLFGGSFSHALERAAEEIAKHAAYRFKENVKTE